MSGSQNPTRCEKILEIPNIPWLSLEALLQLPCSALVWLLRGAVKHQPGQNPTFGWVSSGQGMEKSIRSSVASPESPLPHTPTSAAHASPEEGRHPGLHPCQRPPHQCQRRQALCHRWLMLQKGQICTLEMNTSAWLTQIMTHVPLFHPQFYIPSSLFAAKIWAVRTFMSF